jgi:hypothetical protein
MTLNPVFNHNIIHIARLMVVTELELGDCLMPYHNGPFYKNI